MPSPTFETLLYSVEDGIATITLNRPERMNAFTARMMKDLIEVFDVTDADDAVKVVIVTGAGRAFCAGADLGAGGATFDRTRPRRWSGKRARSATSIATAAAAAPCACMRA
jgi:enoyl-CoA hydratase/carnithine racemase